MSEIDIKKLVHLVVHQNCKDIKCHNKGGERCPLFDTLCDKEFDVDKVDMKEEIIKSMKYHGITKSDIMEYLIGENK